VHANAPQSTIDDLIRATDSVTKIQNTMRAGCAVQLGHDASDPAGQMARCQVYNPATKAWELLTEVPKFEQNIATPEPGSVVVFDEEGNLIAGRAILEEIVASGKPKLVLVERGNSDTQVPHGDGGI
jgi:hypothetical protein